MLIVNDRPNMLHAGRLFQLHCVNQLFKAHCPDFYLKKKKKWRRRGSIPFKWAFRKLLRKLNQELLLLVLKVHHHPLWKCLWKDPFSEIWCSRRWVPGCLLTSPVTREVLRASICASASLSEPVCAEQAHCCAPSQSSSSTEVSLSLVPGDPPLSAVDSP